MIVAIIGISLNPIYSIYLSYEDFAIIGYYSGYNLLVVPFLHFGLLQYYSRQYYFTDPKSRSEFTTTLLLSIIGIGFISFSILYIIFYILHRNFNHSFEFYPYCFLYLFQLVTANITQFYLTKCKIEGKAKSYAIFSILQSILIAAFSLSFIIVFKLGAFGKMLGLLIATLILAITVIKLIVSNYIFDFEILKKALRFCWPLVLSAFLWYFLAGVDRLLLLNQNNVKEYGLYSIAIQIVGYMTIFYSSLSNTFEPDIYKSIVEKNLKKLFLINFTIILIVSILNVLFIVLSQPIVSYLTAFKYTAAVPYVKILALHNITMALYYLIVKIIIGYGYTKLELMIRILGVLFALPTFYILIKNYGFIGASWGQVLSFVEMSLLGIILLIFILRKNKPLKE